MNTPDSAPRKRFIQLNGAVIWSLLTAVVAVGVSACVEVAADRGVTYKSPSRSERLGAAELQFDVMLLTDDGRPLPGVKVSAESSRTTDADTTNSNGKAVLNTKANEDDSIDFHFESDSLEATRTIYALPKGQSKLRLIFKASPSGRVRLVAIEY